MSPVPSHGKPSTELVVRDVISANSHNVAVAKPSAWSADIQVSDGIGHTGHTLQTSGLPFERAESSAEPTFAKSCILHCQVSHTAALAARIAEWFRNEKANAIESSMRDALR